MLNKILLECAGGQFELQHFDVVGVAQAKPYILASSQSVFLYNCENEILSTRYCPYFDIERNEEIYCYYNYPFNYKKYLKYYMEDYTTGSFGSKIVYVESIDASSSIEDCVIQSIKDAGFLVSETTKKNACFKVFDFTDNVVIDYVNDAISFTNSKQYIGIIDPFDETHQYAAFFAINVFAEQ